MCLALNVEEACAALGVSWDFWAEHIAPEVRVVRRGRRKLVAVSELEQWLERNGEATSNANAPTTARRGRRAGAAGSAVASRGQHVAIAGADASGSAGVRRSQPSTRAIGARDG